MDGRVLMVAYTLRRRNDETMPRKSVSSARGARAGASAGRMRRRIDFSDIPEASPDQLGAMRRVGRPPRSGACGWNWWLAWRAGRGPSRPLSSKTSAPPRFRDCFAEDAWAWECLGASNQTPAWCNIVDLLARIRRTAPLGAGLILHRKTPHNLGRSTIPSTGSSPGSSIQKETRSSSGNRRPAN